MQLDLWRCLKMPEAWEPFLLLSKATSLIVSSKVIKWKVSLNQPLTLMFSLTEKILWWFSDCSIAANTGFMQKSMLNREFSVGILRLWTKLLKYLLNVSLITASVRRISRFSVKFIISLALILSEKRSLSDFQDS